MTDEAYKVVSTADEAEHDIYAHEVKTNTNFTIYRRNKGFSSTDTIGWYNVSQYADYKAHKIWWKMENDDRCKIDTNGCPYIILGYDVRECQHGPDRNIKEKIQYKAEKDDVRFIETLDMVDIKKLCNNIRTAELPSFRWNVFRQYNSKKRKDVKMLNCVQFIPSEKIVSKDLKLQVMVSFVMMVEGLNRFQSELFLRTDIHKLIQYSSE
ncbi:unnamed protein product [Mytilus coruscus]|uniref:Uncharacterized protein n=1 Tax=Mytilus coruscus TaxID=42192 RepID=A0A6J8DG52_MYTCO|nr:unnamed protein product [Mytilus coruscus]